MIFNPMDRKILIVDDEADIRDILQFNLENAGFNVDAAASAEEALEMLSTEHSLILLDVMMHGMSGFQMATHLRENGNLTPIIFLTAKDTQDDLLEGFSAGADDSPCIGRESPCHPYHAPSLTNTFWIFGTRSPSTRLLLRKLHI